MKKFTIIALALIVVNACKPDEAIKGIDNFNIALNSDVFKYRIHLDVKDENGNPIPNAEIELVGEDADILFTEFGTRDYQTNSQGKITLTVHPSFEPTASKPVVAEVFVKSNNYEKGIQSITINEGQFDMEGEIGLWSLQGLKDKLGMETFPIGSTNGKVNGSMILNKNKRMVQVLNAVNLDTVYYDNNDAAVLIEDGTEFYYYYDAYREYPRYVKSTKELFDTVEVNGALVPISVSEEFVVDTVWEKYHYLERKLFKGDKIELKTVVIPYGKEGLNYALSYGENDRTIHTMRGSGLNKQAFLEQITKAKSVSVLFHGVLEDGKPVEIYPVDYSKIIYSYVIDESFINPKTNMTIAEGDTVEMGKKFILEGGSYHYETKRSVVKRAANGQLRVQDYSSNFGFYKLYPYEYKLDLNLVANAPDTNIIPDLENLRFEADVYLPSSSSNHKIYLNHFWDRSAKSWYKDGYKINTTVYSNEPLQTAKIDVWAGYWGTKWKDEFVVEQNQGEVNIFRNTWKNAEQFKELTTYNLSVVCAANDSMVLYPTATASSRIGDYPVYVYLKNGKWATRGISVGDTMKFSIEYKNWSLDTSFVLTKPKNTIRYIDETNLDICNL